MYFNSLFSSSEFKSIYILISVLKVVLVLLHRTDMDPTLYPTRDVLFCSVFFSGLSVLYSVFLGFLQAIATEREQSLSRQGLLASRSKMRESRDANSPVSGVIRMPGVDAAASARKPRPPSFPSFPWFAAGAESRDWWGEEEVPLAQLLSCCQDIMHLVGIHHVQTPAMILLSVCGGG